MIREYIRRFTICAAALALYGFGNVFAIKAGDVGTNAWNTLALGVSDVTAISFGTAMLAISGVIVIFDLLGRGKLGFGTLLNTLLIPFFSDLFLARLSAIPAAPNLVWGVVYTLLGQLILSFAAVFYMLPALGCGPRDTMMVLVGRKVPRLPIGGVKLGIEAVVLVVGVLLGAPFGLGTVLVLLLQSAMFQLACTVCRYEPRSVEHEDFIDTYKRWKNKK